MEKVIKGIQECDLNGGLIGNCPYKGILALLKEQDEIISELLKVGYPHGYEKEEPWIVDYMQLITEVVKKAVHLRNGTE